MYFEEIFELVLKWENLIRIDWLVGKFFQQA